MNELGLNAVPQVNISSNNVAKKGKLLRFPQVRAIVPGSRPTLYRWMKLPKDPFPGPVHVAGGTASFWWEDEVLAWLDRNVSRTPNPPVASAPAPAHPQAAR